MKNIVQNVLLQKVVHWVPLNGIKVSVINQLNAINYIQTGKSKRTPLYLTYEISSIAYCYHMLNAVSDERTQSDYIK